ncbi:MAG: hypothetical protein V7724_19190 [Sediminicola sp.]
MEQNEDDKWEALLRDSVRMTGLEEPSPNFTASVISKIAALPVPSGKIVYKPLIPKWAWAAMAVCAGVLLPFGLWKTSGNGTSWMFFEQMEGLAEYHAFAKIFKMEVSEGFLYGMVALAFFIFIQVFVLKSYWNKRSVLY